MRSFGVRQLAAALAPASLLAGNCVQCGSPSLSESEDCDEVAAPNSCRTIRRCHALSWLAL